MAPDYGFVDAFALFGNEWSRLAGLTPVEQAGAWVRCFNERWPELARKYTESHASHGEEWRAVLADRFFSQAERLLPKMHGAAEALPVITREVAAKARQMGLLDFAVRFVMVGPSGYAGWATRCEGCRACLFGLDTIADLGWQAPETLAGLAAHELGHLIHAEWREREGLPDGRGPFWQQYGEGFAHAVERQVVGRVVCHEEATTPGWTEWCAAHVSFLAREFLGAARAGEPMYRFFGSLPHLNVCGYRQTGYFLGNEILRGLESRIGLRAAAILSSAQVDSEMAAALAALAAG